jgi:hypothetical protein
MNEKIFINIASFRDPSLIITIKSALLHAAHPENLVFGIGLQYYDDEIPNLSFIENQIRTLSYHPDTRPGVVKVRYEISKLIADEKYFLMIDSHTLFYPNWDEIAIRNLAAAEKKSNHDKVIISGNNLHSSGKLFYSYIYKIEDGFEDYPILNLIPKYYKKEEEIFQHYHIDCSSLFTYSNFLTDVGLDSHSDFLLEEPYLSWKAHISGWDVYVPESLYLYQSPFSYFNIVWNNDIESKSYMRKETAPSNKDRIDMFSAMVFNKSQAYSAKNQRRSEDSFWELVGQKNSFNKLKKSKKFAQQLKNHNIFNVEDLSHNIN